MNQIGISFDEEFKIQGANNKRDGAHVLRLRPRSVTLLRLALAGKNLAGDSGRPQSSARWLAYRCKSTETNAREREFRGAAFSEQSSRPADAPVHQFLLTEDRSPSTA